MVSKLPIFPMACLVGVLAVASLLCQHLMRADTTARPRGPAGPVAVDVTPGGARISDPALPKPEALIEAAIAALQTRRSIAARLMLEVNRFDRQLVGSGIYLEQDRSIVHDLRVELNIQHDEQTSSLLQVCDGRFFWTYERVADKTKLARIDVVRATQAMQQASQLAGQRVPDGWPNLGGMAKVLRSLSGTFVFSSVEATRIERRPVWVLRGSWRPHWLAKLLPKQKKAIDEGKAADLEDLPGHLPDRVALFLGRDDLFPYRLEFCRAPPKKGGAAAAESEPLVIAYLQFVEVNVNVVIDPMRFSYNPGNLKPVDQTEQFLAEHGLKSP